MPEAARDARALGDVLEGAVALVAVEDVAPTLQAGRAARHRHPLVPAQPGVGHWRGLQLHVDVVGHEEVEAAVPVVVEQRAAGAPAPGRGESRARRHVLEGAVALVAKQPALAPVRDVEVVEAVVVVVADAGALAPPVLHEPGLGRDVLEGGIAAVAVQVGGRLLPLGKPLERGAVGEEHVEPPVVVDVDERHAAPGGLEQVAVGVTTAVDRLGRQPRLWRDVHEAEPEVRRGLCAGAEAVATQGCHPRNKRSTATHSAPAGGAALGASACVSVGKRPAPVRAMRNPGGHRPDGLCDAGLRAA